MVNAKDTRSLVRAGGFSTRPKKGQKAHKQVRKLISRSKHLFFKDFDSTLGYPGEGPGPAKPRRVNGRKVNTGTRKCNICSKPGHLQAVCPERKQGPQRGPLRSKCTICGKAGHKSSLCQSAEAVARDYEAKADFKCEGKVRSPRTNIDGEGSAESGTAYDNDDLKVFREYVRADAPTGKPMATATPRYVPEAAVLTAMGFSTKVANFKRHDFQFAFPFHTMLYTVVVDTWLYVQAGEIFDVFGVATANTLRAEQKNAALALKIAADEEAAKVADKEKTAIEKLASERKVLESQSVATKVTVSTLLLTKDCEDLSNRDLATRRAGSNTRSLIGNKLLTEAEVLKLATDVASGVRLATTAAMTIERSRVVIDATEAQYFANASLRDRVVTNFSGRREAEVLKELRKAPTDSLVVLTPKPVCWVSALKEEAAKMVLGLLGSLVPAISFAAAETVADHGTTFRPARAARTFLWRTAAHFAVSIPTYLATRYAAGIEKNSRATVIGRLAAAARVPVTLLAGLAGSTLLHIAWNWVANRMNCACKLLFGRSKPKSLVLPRMEDTCLEGKAPAPTQAAFVVSQLGDAVCEPRACMPVLFGVRDVTPTVFRLCCHNEAIGLAGRIGKKIPSTDPVVNDSVILAWKQVTKSTLPLITALVGKTTRPVPMKEWLASFPPRKRAMIQSVIDAPDHVALSRLVASSFPKREKANKSTEDCIVFQHEHFKDPRIIQGCPIELTVATGRYIRRAAKALRKGLMPRRTDGLDLDSGRHIVYTCGMQPDEIGSTIWKFEAAITSMLLPGERLVWVEDDQSRFDLHLTEGPFSFIHKAHSALLPRAVAKRLRRTAKSRGRTNLGTRYTVPFTMQSGWPDTSYTDTLTNAAMKLYIHGVGKRWFCIICGDDSLTCTVDTELAALGGCLGLEAAYAKLGMEVEAKSSYHLRDVEFCSGVFVESDATHYLVPKFGKMVARLGTDMQVRSPKDTVQWAWSLVSTLKCFSRFFRQLDVLASTLSAQLPAGSGGPIVEPYKLDYTRGADIPLRDQAYHLFTRYDLSAQDMVQLETEFSQVKVGQLMTGGVINAMALRDL